MKHYSCVDIAKVLEFGCCPSCHEDANMGYDELSEDEYGDVIIYYCCGASAALEEKVGHWPKDEDWENLIKEIKEKE